MNAKTLFCLAAALTVAPAAFAQTGLPDSIKVPDGHTIAMETTGVGEITYECRDKANAVGQTEWFFVGPKAVLNDRSGKPVGNYFGPPATWQAQDGSKITGTPSMYVLHGRTKSNQLCSFQTTPRKQRTFAPWTGPETGSTCSKPTC